MTSANPLTDFFSAEYIIRSPVDLEIENPGGDQAVVNQSGFFILLLVSVFSPIVRGERDSESQLLIVKEVFITEAPPTPGCGKRLIVGR